MSEKEIIAAILDASPMAMLAIAIVLLILKAPGILEGWSHLQERTTETEKERARGFEAVQQRAMETVTAAVRAMTEAQADSRSFYMDKLEAMRSGVSLLEGRVRDLETQVEDKDRRIKEQEARIKELETDNAKLRQEIDTLNKKLNAKEARKNAKGTTPVTAVAGAD